MIHLEEFLVFQSRTFPASMESVSFDDEETACGIPLLTAILEQIESAETAVVLDPVSEGSGCSAYVACSGVEVSLHLSRDRAGRGREQRRDVWTLQVGPSGGLFQRVLRRLRKGADQERTRVLELLERALYDQPAEYSDIRKSTWLEING